MKKVKIYTDGSCLGNPGPGGYAAILRYNDKEIELTKGYYLTTNNRMELMATIAALEKLKEKCDCYLYTDSQYVRNGINQWILNWKNNGWRTSHKKPVKNVDLWQRLDALLQKQTVTWFWVKGHAGHIENERCDLIAKTSALKPTLHDKGFIPQEKQNV